MLQRRGRVPRLDGRVTAIFNIAADPRQFRAHPVEIRISVSTSGASRQKTSTTLPPPGPALLQRSTLFIPVPRRSRVDPASILIIDLPLSLSPLFHRRQPRCNAWIIAGSCLNRPTAWDTLSHVVSKLPLYTRYRLHDPRTKNHSETMTA